MTTITVSTHNASDEELEAIAFLVDLARPDWEPWLTRSVLQAHRNQVDASDLCVASLRAARNPDYRNPKTIGWRGPHWEGLATRPEDQVQRLVRCGVCGKREDRCETERIGRDDDHEFEPVRVRGR